MNVAHDHDVHGLRFLALASARSAYLSARDLASVGLWYPQLWAWRVETSLRHAIARDGRARRFDAHLTARVAGQASASFVQGSTPWFVLRSVARMMYLSDGVRFVDVGAGEGFAAAVLSSISGAAGFAVEPLEPLRIRAAQAYAALGLPVQALASLDDVALRECMAAYVGWTCFDPPARARITTALHSLPLGARVVTVTHPPASSGLRIVQHSRAPFPWGSADLFVAERT